MERMTEPPEIKIGSRVFRGVPANLRPMDPKLDVGTVVDYGLTEGMVWVELTGLNGKKVRTPLRVDTLEVIG